MRRRWGTLLQSLIMHIWTQVKKCTAVGKQNVDNILLPRGLIKSFLDPLDLQRAGGGRVGVLGCTTRCVSEIPAPFFSSSVLKDLGKSIREEKFGSEESKVSVSAEWRRAAFFPPHPHENLALCLLVRRGWRTGQIETQREICVCEEEWRHLFRGLFEWFQQRSAEREASACCVCTQRSSFVFPKNNWAFHWKPEDTDNLTAAL